MSNPPPLVVIGSGGHAGVLIRTLQMLGRAILYATDFDAKRHGSFVFGVHVRGDDSLIEQHGTENIELVNGIGSVGNMHARERIGQIWRARGYRFATIVHPSAFVDQSASLAEGCQVMAQAAIQVGSKLGIDTIVNTKASVDHDCTIGDFVHISPGATICGGVCIGQRTHVGAGATIIQSITLGSDVLIGAGAVVVSRIESGTKALGVPARPMSCPSDSNSNEPYPRPSTEQQEIR